MENATGKVVVVTGAAGGLGTALVREFAAQGWRVGAVYHERPVAEVSDSVIPIQCSVTNSKAIQSAVSQVLEKWSRIDALINNAGVTADGLLTQMDDADWDRVLDVNLKGAFLCAQAVVRPMMKQGDGHIINLSSFSGRRGAKGQVNYSAAKAGLLGLTESLAREVGSRNIRVNAVLPGVLPTPMTADLSEGVMATFTDANALGRINTLEEVARFVVFISGMQNVSGQLFQLDSRIGRWA